MVKCKQLYHNKKDKLIKGENYFYILKKTEGKKVLVKNIIKKGRYINGIKDSENGIS